MKSIQILGEVYQLKHVKGLMEREHCEGYCDPHSYTIFMDASLRRNKPRVYRRVLLHEICHAFVFESGLHEFMSHQANEMFAQTMSGLVDKLYPQLAHLLKAHGQNKNSAIRGNGTRNRKRSKSPKRR